MGMSLLYASATVAQHWHGAASAIKIEDQSNLNFLTIKMRYLPPHDSSLRHITGRKRQQKEKRYVDLKFL